MDEYADSDEYLCGMDTAEDNLGEFMVIEGRDGDREQQHRHAKRGPNSR
jgi:hypothetical protein